MRELLNYIVEASKVQITAQHPHGWCYVQAGTDVNDLVSNDLVQANLTARAADGSFPVRPTEAGVKMANSPVEALQPATQLVPLQARPDPANIKIEMGIPVPEKQAFGRTSTGDDNVTKWKFDAMQVNESFFLPQPPNTEAPIHRSFSSIVSQANKKLWPKNFVIRAWDGGARVWRVENLKEKRPTRKPKENKPQPVTAAATGPQFPGGFAAPGNSEFGGAPQMPFAPGPQPFGGGFEAQHSFDPAGFSAEPGLPEFGE